MTRFIKTCRQVVECEWNGARLYPTYPNISNIHSVALMEEVLVKADTKSNQMAKFYELLHESEDCFAPFAHTIHRYLKKYDTQWYTNEYSGANY